MKTKRRVKKQLGDYGEEIAVNYLQKQGYEILKRNFRSRFGEIDIIAKKSSQYFLQTLCFIEVKFRNANPNTVQAESAVNKNKLRKIQKTAKYFYQLFVCDLPVQFEQISIYRFKNKYRIIHYIIDF